MTKPIDPNREAAKKEEVLRYLHEHVFNPILASKEASESLKRGIRITIARMENLSSASIVKYYWSAIMGTDRSIKFAHNMRSEGFTRFEEIIEDFRVRFSDKWLRS